MKTFFFFLNTLNWLYHYCALLSCSSSGNGKVGRCLWTSECKFCVPGTSIETSSHQCRAVIKMPCLTIIPHKYCASVAVILDVSDIIYIWNFDLSTDYYFFAYLKCKYAVGIDCPPFGGKIFINSLTASFKYKEGQVILKLCLVVTSINIYAIFQCPLPNVLHGHGHEQYFCDWEVVIREVIAAVLGSGKPFAFMFTFCLRQVQILHQSFTL